MVYHADENRYQTMEYRRCGQSGLKLPVISLGLWHNFGDTTQVENSRSLLQRAFDLGITHFDLANNYGPPPGSAELNFGPYFAGRFFTVAGRTHYFHQGGLHHVGWPLRRLGFA